MGGGIEDLLIARSFYVLRATNAQIREDIMTSLLSVHLIASCKERVI